jgi:3-isopropylmalate dehydratase small subunit
MPDFGIRCVVAFSFGEIHFANCFKNGMLLILKSGDGISERSSYDSAPRVCGVPRC